MALYKLLSMIPHEVAYARRSVLARWTETPETGEWDAEPSYGAFVDDLGQVMTGSRPSRAFLESDDPGHMELAPEVEQSLGDATVYFLDWGHQPVSWEEVFDLWEAWEAQGMIADCGSVSVSWALSTRWTAPGWVAFRGTFDGAPLALIARQAAQQSGSPSFLARALVLKGLEARQSVFPDGELPMLPFTLQALKDPGHSWPAGVA